ncbi:DUF6796 family protein [Sphingobacterium sp. LRF_L2]|uniref:DUF6796 family protein n=1 Tax=Sphingobacterium sp. LRF_L2 TaxID=3369421 RepID=UPI003F6384BD
MQYQTKIRWSLISGILAALCWIVGDMFVAGFSVNPADYPLFSETYAGKVDVDLAVLMLEGSSNRLMFGALIGAMTATLFLPGIWLSYQFVIDKSKWYALGIYFMLIVSVLLSPLGHAVYFYVGEIHKAIYHTDPIAHPYLLETANAFTKSLYITWGTAILVMFIGWLLFSILIFTGKTMFPKWAGLVTPLFLTIYQLPLQLILPASDFKGFIGSAAFNISYFIFFVLVQVFFIKKLKHKDMRTGN